MKGVLPRPLIFLWALHLFISSEPCVVQGAGQACRNDNPSLNKKLGTPVRQAKMGKGRGKSSVGDPFCDGCRMY